MPGRRAIAGTVLSVCLGGGCTRPNPAYEGDDGSVEELPSGLDADADEDALVTDGEVASSEGEDPSGGGGAGSTGGASDGDDDDEPAPEVPSEEPLLYSTLDSAAAVVAPAVGVGPGLVSELPPEVVPGESGQALRFGAPARWVAFPQRSDGIANIDHRAGVLELDVQFERQAPHLEPCDLFALSGVLSDGGGLRVGVADLLDDNRLWVQYIDAAGIGYLTRFPAGLLPPGEWVHLTLAWQADAAEGEPNVSLWIDGVAIEPLPGFAAGPKVVGDPSDEDVILLGAWSLTGGYPAQASFDELHVFAGD